MVTLLSYHNSAQVKHKYLARFGGARSDSCIDQDSGMNGFVGTMHGGRYTHSLFPLEMGWPLWLAHLAEGIFDNLRPEEAEQFGTDLIDAVPVGVDLEPVRHVLAIRRIGRVREAVLRQISDGMRTSALPHEDEVFAALDLLCHFHRQSLSHTGTSSINLTTPMVLAAANNAGNMAARKDDLLAQSAAYSAKWSAHLGQRSVKWSAEAAIDAGLTWKQERDDLLEVVASLKP